MGEMLLHGKNASCWMCGTSIIAASGSMSRSFLELSFVSGRDVTSATANTQPCRNSLERLRRKFCGLKRGAQHQDPEASPAAKMRASAENLRSTALFP